MEARIQPRNARHANPVLLAACAFLLLVTAALAHGRWAWIAEGNYRSPVSNEWCCGKDDCFELPADAVEIRGAGYFIKPLGETVPQAEALLSEDGKYWRCQRPNGTRRCFFAPGLGS